MRKTFLAGIATLLPIILTGYVLNWVFLFMDDIPSAILRQFLQTEIPGLGFLLTVVFVFLVGLLAQRVIGDRIKNRIHRLLMRTPIVRSVYGPLKQIVDSFTGDASDTFKEVVMIEYPRRGTYSLAFVTSRRSGEPQELTGQNLLNCFVPTTPNPTSGYYLLVPVEEAIPLNMTIEEGLKMIVSAGIMYPIRCTDIPDAGGPDTPPVPGPPPSLP